MSIDIIQLVRRALTFLRQLHDCNHMTYGSSGSVRIVILTPLTMLQLAIGSATCMYMTGTCAN